MANQDYSHTAELMKASLPYFDSRTRSQVELFSKVLDLMGSLNSLTGRGRMVAYGYEAVSIDVEGLLNGIRPFCDQKEREFVDRILNIFNIKRIFEMYNNFMNMMNVMQEAGGFSFNNEEANKDDTDNVTGNFTGFNFDSIFHNYDNVSEMPKEEDSNGQQEGGDYNNDYYASFGATENSEAAADHNEDLHTDNSDSTKSNNNTAFKMDSGMFEMFKGMVPPEQMSTFENLRMLFNTMSYDNNKKPNDGKEHEYG